LKKLDSAERPQSVDQALDENGGDFTGSVDQQTMNDLSEVEDI
jgi:hypothetical protein